MIHIDFDPTTLTDDQQTWWNAWETRAQAATTEVLEAWEASRTNSSFNLNDGRIKADRLRAQEEAKTTFDVLTKFYRIDDDTLSLNDAKRRAKTHRKIVRYLNGAAPYSAAVVDYLGRENENIFLKTQSL